MLSSRTAGISGRPQWIAELWTMAKPFQKKGYLFFGWYFTIHKSKEFVRGKNQNSMSEEHIQRIVDAYVARKDEDKFAHVATLDEI